MNETDCFRVPSEISLRLRFFGDEAAVYNCLSAETHLLEYRCAVLLDRIIEKPCSSSELLKVLQLADTESPEEALFEYQASALSSLSQMGLVELCETAG